MQTAFLGRRLIQAIATIFFIVVLNFLLFRIMPGSPERILLRNPHLTEQTVAAARERWGLDKPVFPDQLVAYLGATAQGDLGFSFQYRGKAVTEVIESRFWPTIILIGLAEVVAIISGFRKGRLEGALAEKLDARLDTLLSGDFDDSRADPYGVIGWEARPRTAVMHVVEAA